MKELEHVLKRVHTLDQDGVLKPLKERPLAIARAIAERTKDGDKGTQLAITAIMSGARKQRSTVKTGLAELVELGVLHRYKDGTSPWETDFFRFSQRLLDAAEKDRPYLGKPLIFGATKDWVKTPYKKSNICELKNEETRMDKDFQMNSDGQLLAGQKLAPNYRVVNTPPRPPAAAWGKLNGDVDSPVPPRGAGGVSDVGLLPDQDFFDWLKINGVDRVHIEAQARKKDGKRGAPLGAKFGFRFPVLAAGAAADFGRLTGRMIAVGKKRFDLQTRAAETAAGLSKSILVDDLDSDGVLELKAIWCGPGCILETSPGNFQSILISDWPLDRPARLALQRGLARRLRGDAGATSSIQLHRFPGSSNFKFAEPFLTRAVEYFEGIGPGFDPLQDDSKTTSARNHRTAPVVQPVDQDNSRAAIKWAMSQLSRGAAEADVLAGLRGRWLSHHDPKDWPERTMNKARSYLAG